MTLLFAHRGGVSSGSRPNALAAFADAVARGCDVESDVRLSRDGTPVLVHDAIRLGPGGLVVPALMSTRLLDRLGVPTLAAVLPLLGERHLSLDLKEPRCVEPVLGALAGCDRSRVWLCHEQVSVLAAARALDSSVRLVHEAPLSRIGDRVAHLRRLAAARIDAQNTRFTGWSAADVAVAHEHGILAFGSLAQTPSELVDAARRGLDAIYSDHVEAMKAAFGR